MSLNPQDLALIQADKDVQYWLDPLRIVKGNQENLLQAILAAGVSREKIAKLSVRFDLIVEKNELSRSDYSRPDGPVRGILASTDHSDMASAEVAESLNQDENVLKALRLCELAASEINAARVAVVAGAARKGFAEADILQYGLVFDLNLIAGLSGWGGCTHANCPGVRIC